MKHTFKLIDKIRNFIVTLPYHLNSDQDIADAKKGLEQLRRFDRMLRKIIDAHKTTEHLQKLHACHVDSIPDWAKRVNDQFRRLDGFLAVLEDDIPKLLAILDGGYKLQIEPKGNNWKNKIGDMNYGFVMAGFTRAEHDMKELREAEILERHHLEEILDELEDVEELLK
ncbi:hypothetical protein HN587_07600 [Candidatus Woesearchaeota archaeon]|jgi:hypothetical protein|nr:hypothetical protein [Candidatus Woesearchaeota archaeon]